MINSILSAIRRNPNGLTSHTIIKIVGTNKIASDLVRLVLDRKIERIGDKFYPKNR